jgi:hypothetical protein
LILVTIVDDKFGAQARPPLSISTQTMAIVFWAAVIIGKCVVGVCRAV